MSSSDLSVPPPLYAQQSASSLESDPQILIIPATDSLRFQQGFLGADGERAAIEGELQLKGAHPDRWRKLSVVIRALACHSPAERTFFYSQGPCTSVLSRLHTTKSSSSPKLPSTSRNPEDGFHLRRTGSYLRHRTASTPGAGRRRGSQAAEHQSRTRQDCSCRGWNTNRREQLG